MTPDPPPAHGVSFTAPAQGPDVPRTYHLAVPSLDTAWAEVEAALPEGWERVALTRYRHFPADSRWVADVEDDRPRLDHPIRTYGSTPDEALRSLAARLTEERP